MIINNNGFTDSILQALAICVFLTTCSIQNQKNQAVNEYYVVEDNIEKELNIKKYTQKIFDENFKSLTFSKGSIILGDPFYTMNSQNPVSINFDLLSGHPESLQYQLIHCNKNWEKSNVNSMDAVEGFDSDYIENQQISYGPIQQYVHYNFNLPNQNTKFLISGNYIIKIFVEGIPQQPLAFLKFYVSEQLSNVNFQIDESSNVEQSNYLQAYQIECTYNSGATIDPFSNIFINIQQNHQYFNEQWLSGPNFIKENKLVFLQDDDQTFNGSNEFRFFDISSFRNGSQFVDKTIFRDSCYQVLLRNEVKRSYKQYLDYKDMNGRFFIRTYDNDDFDYQSEYGWVNFNLDMRKQIADSIFIFGQLSNWDLDQKFLMKYDSLTKKYHNKILLKQGFYNYIYVTKNSKKISARAIEGAHFETNNEYVIKVYYQDPIDMYDRILCYKNFKNY